MSPRKNELRLCPPKLPTADEALLITLQTVPGVGETKATALLHCFHCTCVYVVICDVVTDLFNISCTLQ